jgi:hypothetical protein
MWNTVIASAAKQSILSLRGTMDCFAEPVIGRRFAPTRWLAMTVRCLKFEPEMCAAILLAPWRDPSRAGQVKRLLSPSQRTTDGASARPRERQPHAVIGRNHADGQALPQHLVVQIGMHVGDDGAARLEAIDP